VSWLDALGWAGSALLVYSLLQARVLRFRVLNFVASVLLTVFNAVLGIIPMIALNGVLALINAWFILRLTRQRHDVEAYDVLEVSQDDTYLRHVLRIHEDDIRSFFPGVDLDPGMPGRSVFLIVCGDETVGVVMIRDAGDGVARVELDWVAPRFRDFTPGEFVYTRSGLFRERGFSTILTPPGMVAPYYDRLGFRRDGDLFRLDVR